MNAPTQRLPLPEFTALIAMMFATVAFSIDAMLPALPTIAAGLSPEDANRAQLVVISFVMGMGLGTFAVGPLSDRFGRRPVILWGALLYCIACAMAAFAPSLDLLLAARLLQGIGASAPRIVSLAMVRDQYKGREMARIVSFAMMIFSLVPAVAPLLGSFIIAAAGWRGIFVAFIAFSVCGMIWLALRQPETLPPAARRPLSPRSLARTLVEVFSIRTVAVATMVQTLCFACLYAMLASTQQIFDTTFGRADNFPLWFALIAVLAGSASMINAALVVRLGMRLMVRATLLMQILCSGSFALIVAFALPALPEVVYFGLFLGWTVTVFMMAGLTLGNLNAIALEPVGHVAGLAASGTGAIATVVAALVAMPVGLAFNGTPLPLAIGITCFTALGSLLMRLLPRG